MTDVVDGMRPIHTGEVLPKQFLLPMGLSANSLAIPVQVQVQVQVQVPAPRINDVARESAAWQQVIREQKISADNG